MTDGIQVLYFDDEIAQRLDIFLVAQFPEFTRTRVQGLIKAGLVFVDGEVAKKSGVKLQGRHEIQIEVPPIKPSTLIPEDIPLEVIYENQDVVVINKSAGMVVHPSVGHTSGTLVHAVLAHAPDITGIGGEMRPGLVHRLDKDTTGVIILVKNDAALQHIQAQFKNRTVQKHYLALVDGQPKTPAGRIDAPIGRDPKNRKRMAIVQSEKGREAISEYHTVEQFEEHTLLDVKILTGRTHQIRVHMEFMQTPIAADPTYGLRKISIPLDRQFLHAWQLSLILPGESEPRTFEAPLPTELEIILEELRKG